MARIFNEETFKSEVLEGKGLALVDFFADWCGPCKMMAPSIEELAEEYEGKVLIGKINIDEYLNPAMQYKVMSIPTLILFKDGEEVDKSIGLISKSEIGDMIKKHL